jgi:SAM-dependent methyltransferase
MKILRQQIAWSLRRLSLNIPQDALVLEVGSGGNPYPRANVLLDAYEETHERHWDALICDRPTVLSFGENLPFKDKSFDYVIAAHVLEHASDPDRFLRELQRVAHRGYIETPDAFFERINPYMDHRLEVTLRDEVLVIRKKPAWIYDPDLVQLYEKCAKAIITSETIPQHAAEFHMRYFWDEEIKFHIINPEVNAGWTPPARGRVATPSQISFKAKCRLMLLKFIRSWFSQSRRNAKINLLPLMRCPKCHSDELSKLTTPEIVCKGCSALYRIHDNIFDMQ